MSVLAFLFDFFNCVVQACQVLVDAFPLQDPSAGESFSNSLGFGPLFAVVRTGLSACC